MTVLEQIIARMGARHFAVTATKEVPGGWQVKFGERVVSVYKTGRVLVQGKWAGHTRAILGIEEGHKGRLPARGASRKLAR